MTVNITEQICTLETKIAFLEDNVDSINDALYQQQLKIETLERLCKHLSDKVETLKERGPSPLAHNEIPPHY
jgi:SlyX protein